MNNYIFFYFIATALSIYGWIWVLRKYTNLWGLFFFLYTILASAWLIFYFLFFSDYDFSENERLLFSRIDYSLSPITLICFILFIFFFWKKKNEHKIWKQIQKNKVLLTILAIIFSGIFYVTLFTEKIISNIVPDESWVYREVFWELTLLSTSVYISFIPIAFIFFIRKKKELSYIDKARILKIIWVKLIFLTLLIILQVILPLYNIWILEHEIIILFVISVLVIANIIQRYYFSPIWYEISKIVLNALSLIIISFIIWWIIREYNIPSEIFTNDVSSFIFILAYAGLALAIHYFITIFFGHVILSKTQIYIIEGRMSLLKRNMVQFLDIDSLNNYLNTEVEKIFWTKELEILQIKNQKQIDFLSKSFWIMNIKILMDDFVFLEENMIEFDFKKIKTSLSNPFLCVPIYYNSKDVRWLLLLGEKKFWDFYTISEITFIEDLAHILSIHMQYIETYNQLEDISRNLDRKVDEKTIEHNRLISRQKDFIATLSHEVKAPLTSSLLQLDSLSVEIEDHQISEVGIQEEIRAIWDNLSHTKTLLTQLFSTERLERSDTILYPEHINIVELVRGQYDIYKKVNTSHSFSSDITEKSLWINLDKTQFLQVITNLLGNAVKFANPKKPNIHVELRLIWEQVMIAIEDNGIGHDDMDPEEIFEKYTIGKNSTGLGIWLYLCKRIVDLHDGTIVAKKWEKLSWIRIEILLPIG